MQGLMSQPYWGQASAVTCVVETYRQEHATHNTPSATYGTEMAVQGLKAPKKVILLCKTTRLSKVLTMHDGGMVSWL